MAIPDLAGLTSAKKLTPYFGPYYYKNETSIMDNWGRADYLGIVTGEPNEFADHSTMVLAWDSDLDQFWTIEGNVGNRIVITKRSLDKVHGLGSIRGL